MNSVRTFFGILKLELQDAADDCGTMIEAAGMKLAEGTSTEYVTRENTALYRSEIDALHDLVKEISERESSSFASLEEAIAEIRRIVPEKVRDWNYPALMTDLLDRKIGKARKYLDLSA